MLSNRNVTASYEAACRLFWREYHAIFLFLLNSGVIISRKLIIDLCLRVLNKLALFLRVFNMCALFLRAFLTRAQTFRQKLRELNLCVKNHVSSIYMYINHVISSFGLKFLIVACIDNKNFYIWLHRSHELYFLRDHSRELYFACRSCYASFQLRFLREIYTSSMFACILRSILISALFLRANSSELYICVNTTLYSNSSSIFGVHLVTKSFHCQ